MRTFTDEELATIALAAEAMMSDKEICIICELDEDEFREMMMQENGVIYEVITRARLTKELAIRKSIIDSATQGSGPAQAMAMKMIESEKLKRLV